MRDYVLAWTYDHPPHENDLENLTLRNKLLYEKKNKRSQIVFVTFPSIQPNWIEL